MGRASGALWGKKLAVWGMLGSSWGDARKSHGEGEEGWTAAGGAGDGDGDGKERRSGAVLTYRGRGRETEAAEVMAGGTGGSGSGAAASRTWVRPGGERHMGDENTDQGSALRVVFFFAESKISRVKVGCEITRGESSYLPCSSYLKNKLFIVLEVELGLVCVCNGPPGPLCRQTIPWDPRNSLVPPESRCSPGEGQSGSAGGAAPPALRAGFNLPHPIRRQTTQRVFLGVWCLPGFSFFGVFGSVQFPFFFFFFSFLILFFFFLHNSVFPV